jgi:hypothetical protein
MKELGFMSAKSTMFEGALTRAIQIREDSKDAAALQSTI